MDNPKHFVMYYSFVKKYLPAETQSYVMNFMALNVVFHNYEKFTNNTLLFTATKVKIENLEGKTAEQPTSLD